MRFKFLAATAALASLQIRAFNNEPSAVGMVPANSQSDICETVVITTENGPVEINKADFDPKKHKEFKGDAKHNPDGTFKDSKAGHAAAKKAGVTIETEAEKTLAQQIEEAAPHLGVVQDGKKFFLVHKNAEGGMVRKVGFDADNKPLDPPEFAGCEEIVPEGYKSSKEAFDAIKVLTSRATSPASAPVPTE